LSRRNKGVTTITIGRREFCAGLSSLALVAGCSGGCQDVPSDKAPTGPVPDSDAPSALTSTVHGSGSSKVVEVRWGSAVAPDGKVNAARVELMLQAAMDKLGSPWSTWAGATRRISIKVNSITSQSFTHPELAGAVAAGLVGAGADPARVTVWDRDTDSLRKRGYAIDKTGETLGYCCLGTDAAGDPKKPTSAVVGGAKVYLSKLLTEADLLLNIAALKDHSMAGVTLSLKNNLGMIWGADQLHGNFREGSGVEPGISDLAALPDIKGRLQLTVLDALVGVCEGGPGPADPKHTFRHAGILVSLDPVALDRRGLAIIEARRKKLGLDPIGRRTKPNPSPTIHIDNAAGKLG
jgi:uncharacterized protein (DUF362 family)